MCNSCKSVFPNTRAWEQQEWNETKKQKKARREAWVRKEVKRAWKKKNSRRPITTQPIYNNNKQNMAVFYKIWKKYNIIKLTKNKIDNRKIKNHPPFPGVSNQAGLPLLNVLVTLTLPSSSFNYNTGLWSRVQLMQLSSDDPDKLLHRSLQPTRDCLLPLLIKLTMHCPPTYPSVSGWLRRAPGDGGRGGRQKTETRSAGSRGGRCHHAWRISGMLYTGVIELRGGGVEVSGEENGKEEADHS